MIIQGSASRKKRTGKKTQKRGGEIIEENNKETDQDQKCICEGKVQDERWIGCENLNCPYGWFHFKCAGITEEPPQNIEWLCKHCRQ